MKTSFTKMAVCIFLATFFSSYSCVALSQVKGIYLTQTTMENTAELKTLIEKAKAVGINTFVVDMEIPSKRYQQNVSLLKDNNIRYVARVVVFPTGGHPEQISDPKYWEKRYKLVKTAVDYGAAEIQLDYIRYNSKQPASADNAKHISSVVQYFREKVPQSIPLQADVFGISSFGESKHIGQNLRLMAQSVNALCPMVYPSHFEPYREHAVTPYQTIYTSLRALRSQFSENMPVKVYAYIEISNYRFPLPGDKRRNYVLSEMKAVQDANADGWYVWSAHNKYDYLFKLMGQINQQSKDGEVTNAMVAINNPNNKAKSDIAPKSESGIEAAATTELADARTLTTSEDAVAKKEAANNTESRLIHTNESGSEVKTRTIADEVPATRTPVAATSWVRPMSLH